MWTYVRTALFSLIASSVLFTSPVKADTLFLVDGSRLNGDVLGLSGGKVVLSTAYAGEVTIDLDAIDGITLDETALISLDSGDRVHSRLVYDPALGQSLESRFLGTIPISIADLSGLWPEGTATPEILAIEEIEERHRHEVADLEEQHSEEVGQLERALVTPDKAWSGRTQLGVTGSTGNTNRVSLNGKATAQRKTDFDRLDLSLGWRFARENGRETENEIIGQTRLERDFSKHWFAFGSLLLEQDAFEDLDLRSILTAGTGVFFIQNEKQDLKARFGIGYQVEAFKSSPTMKEAILSLGYDYSIQLNGWLLFTHALTWLPSIDDPIKEFRIMSEAALDIPVTESKNWSVRIGLRNQYDKTPVDGNEKLDTFYSISLGYNFQ